MYDSEQMLLNFKRAMMVLIDKVPADIVKRLGELDKYHQPSYIDSIKIKVNAWSAGGSRSEITDWNARLYCDQKLELDPKPEVVCLCGSTRFYDEFMEANYRLTMEGKIVLSVGFFHHQAEKIHGEGVGCTEEQKIMLDELHKRKIDLADAVLVINKEGYIGSSTRSEIDYAKEHGKEIRYLERTSDGFEDMTPEFKQKLKDEIVFCSDTGCSKVTLKNYVQEQYPELDKRAIYRTIKEMIQDGDLFYHDGSSLIKSKALYPNTAASRGRKSRRKRNKEWWKRK
jgi:hypothetical protein